LIFIQVAEIPLPNSRGRWYLSVQVLVDKQVSTGTGHIGIDLGLKTIATCSNGEILERKEYYRKSESKLGIAQLAKKKRQVKTIHAKIKNQRMDTNHKWSTKIVKEKRINSDW